MRLLTLTRCPLHGEHVALRCPACRRGWDRAYAASDEGRAARRKYLRSEKGKAARRRRRAAGRTG